MSIRLDAGDFANEDDAHVGDRPLPGQYHVRVTKVEEKVFGTEEGESRNTIVVDFEVLAGTVPGQEGKVTTEYFALTEKAMPRLMMFALATGLIQPGEHKEVEPTDATGRELIVKLDENKRDGKKYINVTYDGMWSLSNPAVADVPRGEVTDPEEKLTMAQLGGDEPVPSQSSPVAASGADEFGDL